MYEERDTMHRVESRDMIGHFIQPWPGESLLGEVVAVEGDSLVCVARGGLRFTVRIAAINCGQMKDLGIAPGHSPSWIKLTGKAMAVS